MQFSHVTLISDMLYRKVVLYVKKIWNSVIPIGMRSQNMIQCACLIILIYLLLV